MSENIPLRVQFKRMTASEWARSDVILLESEIGFETDTGYAKFGDGKNRFSKLIVGKRGASGNGTAAQGIFINSSAGTTGKMLRIRNKNKDKFYVNPDGGFHSYADSIVDGNLTVKDPTSGKHAATKDYVDKKFDELKKLIQKTD
ncbi:TPA: hypothetical protein VHL18_001580 [Streptococcus pyogenes]|nr:hypothetical protein [Streptococcus pyogenes]